MAVPEVGEQCREGEAGGDPIGRDVELDNLLDADPVDGDGAAHGGDGVRQILILRGDPLQAVFRLLYLCG